MVELSQSNDGGNISDEVVLQSSLVHPQLIRMARADVQNATDGEVMDIDQMSDEDAESLMNLSISRAATQLTSLKTPAAEKVSLIEDLGGDVESDEETPGGESAGPLETTPRQSIEQIIIRSPEMFVGKPPSPESQDMAFPSTWQAGPKPFVAQRLDESRSAIRNALDPLKRRSFSGSGDTLRKLFPSLPKPGSFIPTLPSPSFFSQKTRSRGSTIVQAPEPPVINNYKPMGRDIYFSNVGDLFLPADIKQELSDLVQSPASEHKDFQPKQLGLRRINSDQSLLYHTLSRSSSLGDDTRFKNHSEMTNSRVKAIMDSFPDIPSFKLPSMPTFEAAMNFALNLSSGIGGSSPTKPKTETDTIRTVQSTGQIKNTIRSTTDLEPDQEFERNPQPILEFRDGNIRPNKDPINDNILDRALLSLTGDVVIMGGYRGSVLRSAKPPHRQLWVPVKVGLNIRKVNLEVGLGAEDEERMEETIFPSGMLQNIGPVDMSKRLIKRLRECENAKNGSLRVWDWGYDWRLSPHLLSSKLQMFLEKLPSNQPGAAVKDRGALIIAHSLGGLITRHAINQKPELASGVIYAGVPQSCINILGPMRNGDSVLFSSRVLTAQVNFTLRTSFVFLPLDGSGFIDQTTKEPYPVDFFNVDDWIEYRWSPCISSPLPPKSQPVSSLANMLKASSLPSLPNLQIPGRNSFNAATKSSPSQSLSSSFSPAAQVEHLPSSSPSLFTNAAQVSGAVNAPGQTLPSQTSTIQTPMGRGKPSSSSVSTAVTISLPAATAYLRRTLAETKQFKLELTFNPAHSASNSYPPAAIIYGKSVPTVYAAMVDGRDGIACSDAYEKLAFASGDGVCLARDAMLPEGYNVVRGGRISSDRGHVTLLGDLNAVGKAIEAVRRGREKGVGLGVEREV